MTEPRFESFTFPAMRSLASTHRAPAGAAEKLIPVDLLRGVCATSPEPHTLLNELVHHPLRVADGTVRHGPAGSKHPLRMGEPVIGGGEVPDEASTMPVSGHCGRDISVRRPFPGTHETHDAEHLLGLDRHRSRLL